MERIIRLETASAKEFPDYKQAVSDFIEMNPEAGTLITHEWLDEHLRLDKNSKDYPWKKMSAVADFRRELLEDYQIDLRSIHGKGYYVVSSENQAELAYKDTKTAIKKNLMNGIRRAVNTDTNKLTDEQKKKSERYLSLLLATQKVVLTNNKLVGGNN